MKITLSLLFLFLAFYADCQDEFGSSTFYNAVRKVQAEGLNGFEQLKGNVLRTPYPELRKEYRVKTMLPLADSGKIVVPAEGVPFALYYFEPEKKMETINERATSLRDALVKAYGNPLYTKTITTTTGKKVHSDTYYFSDPGESHTSKALFRTTIYSQGRRYFLSFEIRGK
jgi:hypothetical protein